MLAGSRPGRLLCLHYTSVLQALARELSRIRSHAPPATTLRRSQPCLRRCLQVLLRGLGELEGKLDELQEEDSGVELLHVNCSNTVLAHLPYLIALDHSRRAVVLAIRWVDGAQAWPGGQQLAGPAAVLYARPNPAVAHQPCPT